ncbi:DUF4268 domain-containing protein [soil metagenome]
MELGRLEKVELRNAWQTEDRGFTPWLARVENIEILSQEIGINLEVQGVEQNVGPFRADILCVDADSFESDGQHYVLIENQLEITDHKHLGQLMTYAAGLDAVTLIWIASKFTEEHRAALDWLNRITDETFKFFGIEIELYKIGDSLPAPRFNVIAKPNDWSKDVKSAAKSNVEIGEFGLLRQEYWQDFKNFLEAEKSFLRTRKPPHGLYYDFAIGKSGFGLNANVVGKGKIATNLWLSGSKHKENFDRLRNNCYENSILEFGNEIVWSRNDGNNSSQVFISCNSNYTDKEDWLNQFAWLKGNLEKISNFFKPEIERL